MPPEMPAPVTKSRYFCRAQQRSVRGLRDRSGEPLKSGRLALLEASRIPLWFPLHRLPSIVDAKPPPPPPHHHRSLPTGCPRRPARHPSRRRTPQHHRCTPPHPVAATPRQLPPTPAVETHSANRARRTRRPQRRTRTTAAVRKQTLCLRPTTARSRSLGRAPSPRCIRWRDAEIEVFIMLVRGSTSARCRRPSSRTRLMRSGFCLP